MAEDQGQGGAQGGAFSGEGAASNAPASGTGGSAGPGASSEAGAGASNAGGEGSGVFSGENTPAEPVVPEKYELAPPEGATVPEEITTAFATQAKELKLTQEQAQAAYNVHLQLLQKGFEQGKSQFEEQTKKWEAALPTDKEYGGEKFKENLKVADRGFDALATPELKQVLTDFGLMKHPEVLRVFFRAGAKIVPDTMEHGSTGKGGTGARPDAAARLSQSLYQKQG